MNDIKTIVQSVEGLSSLPAIYLKVNETINDPTSSAADLGSIVEKDHGLTSRLLRLANSAFYAFPGRIDTITRAITIIGFKQLQDLVLAISVKQSFREFGKDSPINMQSFWEHSIACGIASRILATYKGDRNAESYFVAGFLHDIGRLVLLECYPKQYLEVYEITSKEWRLTVDVEKEVFGFTHADLGGELIRSWNLPDSLAEAACYHHDPLQANGYAAFTSVIHFANTLVNAWQIGFSGEHLVPPLNPDAWLLTGLKVSVLESVIKETLSQYQESNAFLISGD